MANPNGTRIYPTLLDRLHANSIRLPWSGCWVWMGYCTRGGHGKITIKEDRRVVSRFVHRVSYALHLQVWPDCSSLPLLRHTCHINSCWRPDHLIRGTQRENVADNTARGKQANGWRLYQERKKQDKHIKDILAGTEGGTK